MKKVCIICLTLLIFSNCNQSKSSILVDKLEIVAQLSEARIRGALKVNKFLYPKVPENVWVEIKNEIDLKTFKTETEILLDKHYTEKEQDDLLSKITTFNYEIVLKPSFLSEFQKTANDFLEYVHESVQISLRKRGYNTPHF